MAQTPESIQPYKELPKNMDYYHLRREGIRFVQELSGDIWTDYNEHDPGITILEQLCYALTELGYKTNFNIEVFIKESFKQKDNHTFFSPDEIFPCQPYTITDYRKFIIYNIPEVKNAWLSPATENIVQGLYNVHLQLTDVDDLVSEQVTNKVRTLLNSNRNLCEDIEKIEILKANKIKLHAKIEIDSSFMGEEVLAQVIYELDKFINPSVKHYPLSQLIKEGQTYSDIFDGPAPKNGFIKDEDLKPLTSEIYISRLSKIILGIEGVLNISNLQIFKDGLKIRGDLIAIDENMFPILEMSLNLSEEDIDPIEIIKSGVRYDIDYNTANHILTTLESNEEGNYESLIDVSHEFETPNIPLSEFEEYYSIQNHFPEIYGIGQLGVSPRSMRDKHGYAKQLKAYLLVFEQLMANYLKQLANIQQLFSLNSSLKTTYFYQVLTEASVPKINEIITNQELMEDELQKINLKYERFEERRGKFLDHLLARFNESFPTQRLISNYKNVLPQEHRAKAGEEIITNKINFLKGYIKIGRERGRGFDYLRPVDVQNISDVRNLSGLHFRLESLLNIKPTKRKISLLTVKSTKGKIYLLNIKPTKGKIYLLSMKPTEGEIYLLSIESTERKISDVITNSSINVFSPRGESETTTKSILLEEREVIYQAMEENNTPQFFSKKESILEEVLTQGIFRRNYEIYEYDDTFTVLFKTGRNNRLELFKRDSLEAAKHYIDKIIQYLYQLSKDSEGFYIVEHTLLRPIAKTFYGLELLDENNQPILVQYKYQKLEFQELIAENLDKLGTARERYIIEPKGDVFEILLTQDAADNDGNPITETVAKYIETVETEDAANKIIDKIIQFLKLNYDNGTDIFTLVQFPTADERTSYLEEKYYDFKVSIILPKWCNRFNNEDFKQLFFQTVQTNIPAHIKVDYHWMSHKDMIEFETCSEQWLLEKQKTEKNIMNTDTASYIVAHLLKLHTLKSDNKQISTLRSDIEAAKADIGIN